MYRLSNRTVSRIYLKQDGETVLIETLLSKKLSSKQTVKIADLRKNEEPENHLEELANLADE